MLLNNLRIAKKNKVNSLRKAVKGYKISAVSWKKKGEGKGDAGKVAEETRGTPETLEIVGTAGEAVETLEGLRLAYKEKKGMLEGIKNRIRQFRVDSKRTILFLGAGRSATVAIDYLIQHAAEENWFVRVGDFDVELAKRKTRHSDYAVGFQFNAMDETQRREEIKKASVVISLLPIHLHSLVAKDCVTLGTSMITASYLSDEMKGLNDKAKENGVLLLNEMGVDPGIDHMSCMNSVREILESGGDITRVETMTGGLIAPECSNNPWNYKFTWFPRNVVLAGKGGVKFLHHGNYKYVPYHNVFNRIEGLTVDGMNFEAYANRDSLKYRELYDLLHVPTFFRGTLRNPGFCSGWNILVQLGLTDDSFKINCEHMTYRQFTNSFLFYRKEDTVELKLAYTLSLSLDSPEMKNLQWLGLFENRPITIKEGSPADILLSLLEKKWHMRPDDKDMIVMLNKFEYYNSEGTKMYYESHLVRKGENAERSAMAATVGLPCAISARLYLNEKLPLTGVHIPTIPEIYKPVLESLTHEGITFHTTITEIPDDKE